MAVPLVLEERRWLHAGVRQGGQLYALLTSLIVDDHPEMCQTLQAHNKVL